MLTEIKKIFFFLLILIFSTTLQAKEIPEPEGFPKCYKNDIRQDNFCPIESKLGHKLFLVDFTSEWNQSQVDWVEGRIFGDGLIKDTHPYYKLTYIKIDGTDPHSQVPVYSKCRFKKGSKTRFAGDKVNKKCEGSDFVKKIYNDWLDTLIAVQKDFFQNKKADQSLIYEYITYVLRENKADFSNDYGERELIIVSDLMQYSERVNFFKHCMTASEWAKAPKLRKANKCRSFETLLKKNKSFANYIKATKPSKDTLENLKVKVLYINHDCQTRKDLYLTLLELWEDFFKHLGITNYEIIPQLDMKDNCKRKT